MRHRSKRHNFHRRPGPRVALIRGLVYSLVEHGRIKTTVARAKEVRRHVEKAITLGKKATLHSRRLLLSRFPNENVVEIIATDLQKRFAKRPGGYTRIVRVGARPGDQSDMAFLEFVDFTPPKAEGEETVKGDAGAKARVRTKSAERSRLRKNVRRIQSASRREARA
ncbi:MAG: 50S ribosomal protein L17 [Calothrix sp. SM1_5_4]|nr:50S ribosomal protein L17 [Calothrix sp. SM1_5_4]